MSDYIAYAGDRTWKHCDTLEEANEWLSQVGGGRVYVERARLAAAEAERDELEETNSNNVRAYMYQVSDLEKRLAAAEAERAEDRDAVKKAGIVFQRIGTDLVALNMPADECRRLLREACEMPRYCTRFEEWKERAAKAGGCDAPKHTLHTLW